ncbi:MAG: hypothetical protein GTO02_11080 [Candidatus Dadabacteria bacterium]|nr:hypothetical protein [Candidatus Dadabacteria bacterium]
MNLTLTVSHNIFLSRKQRYDLFKEEPVDVIGVSIPVWYWQGVTSEPGNEVFCKYRLIPNDSKIFVKHNNQGYEIYLPKKSYNSEDDTNNPVTLKNIIDHKDGGIEWIAFRQYGKAKRNKKTVDIVHFVDIKTIEELEESIG